MTDVKRRTFVWHFDSPVEAIWPVLADTARFNEAANVPKHHIDEIAQADGSVRYMAHARKGPFKLEWEDKPVNWVVNRWFRHCRYFQSGPLKFLCATLEFFPDNGGCRGEYTIETEAANLLGRLILGTRFFPSIESNFGRLADNAREFGAGRAEREFDVKSPTLAEGATDRARHLVSQIEATPYGHGLAQRLADYVTSRQEVDVWAIRPLKLARLGTCPSASLSKSACKRPSKDSSACAGTYCARAARLERDRSSPLTSFRRAPTARPATSTAAATTLKTSSSPSTLPVRSAISTAASTACSDR